MVSLLEDLQLAVGIFDLLVEFVYLLLKLLLRFFCLGGKLLTLLLNLSVFSQKILFKFLMNQGLSPDGRFDVLDFGKESLLRLIEYSSLVGDFRLGFFGKVRDLNFSLLLYLHKIFLDFLYLGLILSYFLLILLRLKYLLLLNLLDFDIEILLLLQQLPQLVLVLKFMSDEGVELLSRIVLDELD